MEAYNLYENPYLSFDGKKEDISKIASWAIWATPAKDNLSTKDSIGDLSVFDESSIKSLLKSNFIFVGLNPSYKGKNRTKNPCCNCNRSGDCDEQKLLKNMEFPSWHNFHSGCTKRSQDYKLRKIFYEYDFGEKFKGSLIIDLLPKKGDQNAEDVLKSTSPEEIKDGLKKLSVIWERLGRNSVIVPMGRASFDQFIKYKDLIPEGMIIRGIRHFSARGYSKFEKAVRQLSEDDCKCTDLIIYTGEDVVKVARTAKNK